MASPIEDQLVSCMLEMIPPRVIVHYDGEERGDPGGDRVVLMSRQERLGDYRADIYLRIDGGAFSMAIECDGHQWHERTKQQAAYDRARDRELMCRRVFTIRFTGSEIVHSPERCAADAWRCAWTLLELDERYLEMWMDGRYAAEAQANLAAP